MQGHLIAATDGSSFEGVGAFAVVTDQESFATGDSSEDQSAFRQEALAFLALFRALCTVVPLPAGRVTVLYDCAAVVAAIAKARLPSCLACAPSWLHYGQPCKHVVVMWSSYGSQAMISTLPLCSRFCRSLNALADRAANQARANRWHPSLRRSWFEASRAAHAWELAAIRASAGASEVLKDHLQPLSRRPKAPSTACAVPMCSDSGS